MSKRKLHEASQEEGSYATPPSKRLRVEYHSLSQLSDELLVRILSFLSVADLAICQKSCRRLSSLASDSQLWKALYYNHFIRPRAVKVAGISDSALSHSSKTSNWLDEQHLTIHGGNIDWKAKYRLRYNWSIGSPQASEILLQNHASTVQPFIRTQGDFAIAVDPHNGLRAWQLKGEKCLVASCPLDGDDNSSSSTQPRPTAIALNNRSEPISVVVGFSDGSWRVYVLKHHPYRFEQRYKYGASVGGPFIAAAYAHPYLVTLSERRFLRAYSFPADLIKSGTDLSSPQLLCCLTSQTTQSPLSVSLRTLPTGLVTSVAYMLPSYSQVWDVGIQELQINWNGEIQECRIAVAESLEASSSSTARPRGSALKKNINQAHLISNNTQPLSLSYSHPYLLVARHDNTLMLHEVKSSPSHVNISSGHRLWGHTSSVSDVQVGERGKAISATSAGDELRVWDLESALPLRKRSSLMMSSTLVKSHTDGSVQDTVGIDIESTSPYNHRVVGFDRERIVTLREDRKRALVVYDFS